MGNERETRFELARWVTIKAPLARYNLGTSEIQGRTLGEFLPDRDLKVGSGKFDGDVELRQLLAGMYGVETGNIALSAGASEGNFLAFYSFFKNGGKVVVENPAYTPLFELGNFLGLEVRKWERKFENGYGLDLEGLKELVDGAGLVVITNLHNPTGAAIEARDLKAVAEIAADAGAWILCDEIFRDFVTDITAPAISCGENCITTSSVSKFHGFGGLRVGWIAASKEFIRKILGIREMTSVCCSRVDETIAKLILKDEALVAFARKKANDNRRIIRKWIENTGKASWVEPAGGILCFPKLEGVDDSRRFAEYLFDNHQTLVAPGYYFGTEGHIRLGFGGDSTVVKSGLEAIGSALENFG
jgi:aspartate/methionine/tyrosine aminotransferase